MFIVLGIIILGVLIGAQIRVPRASIVLSKLLNGIIYLLLLVMGIAVGGNEDIVNNLSTIGLQAFIITFGAVLGSLCFAYIIYRWAFKGGVKL
ncbi:MAG: LysO family transporter [Rikenellaceae bacterium]